jgi:hypothetical protein
MEAVDIPRFEVADGVLVCGSVGKKLGKRYEGHGVFSVVLVVDAGGGDQVVDGAG